MDKARFISVEGIEGVGKSTHLRFIQTWLTRHGVHVVRTREPGGTRVAEQIRELLLDPGHRRVPPMSELLLLFAARASHVEEVIQPALAGGRWVLCDRFSDASYAYQGGGRKLRAQSIAILEHMVLKGLRPDLTLLLDAPVPVALTRMHRRGARDRFERERLEFFQRVRHAYLQRARRHARRFRIVDASGALAEVRAQIRTILEERVAPWL